MHDNRQHPTQDIIDKIYELLVKKFLENSKGSRKPNNKVGRRTHTTTKRKKKRYLYARTQEFYKKDPGSLARYIREGITWQEKLRLFYNLILVSRTHPTEWNENRTILLPKQGKDPESIGNYRPTTIGSILGRVYWGIIDTLQYPTLVTPTKNKEHHVRGSGQLPGRTHPQVN